MTGIHFAHPSNRFWPALKKAGIINWVPDVSPIAPSIPAGLRSERLRTAATQTHFGHPSNRLYPALSRAGIIDWTVGPDTGMTDAQREEFVFLGMGITNLVPRATVRASELSRTELRQGGERLRDLVGEMSPRLVAVAGVTAYREAFGERRATLGRQSSDLGPSALWVVPNPSGLNAHETIDTLADWYLKVAREAGVL